MVAVLDPVVVREEAPRRIRFTRRDVDRLLDLGAFAGKRFELIHGDLIDKMGQSPPHAYTVAMLMDWLIRVFGIGRVRCQLPIEVAQSDRDLNYLEPDLVVLAGPNRDYAVRHPNGNEVVLLVEVADSAVRLIRRSRLPCMPARVSRNIGFWMSISGSCRSTVDR